MESALGFGHTLLSFVVVLSIIVFVHEFGHYIVAKLCGVRITAFSIGFGKEIYGFNDRSGTRWKFSLLPLGGYVKMFGDASAASTADTNALERMSDAERAVSFHYKPLWQKALVVVAGPAANFLLTISIFTYFIVSNGLPSVEPVVGAVMEQSAAAEAGLKTGDRILSVDNKTVKSFNDIPYYISTNLGTPVQLGVERAGETLSITLTPNLTEEKDDLGNTGKRPLIGIKSQEIKYEDVGPVRAVGEAVERTYMICVATLEALKQMVMGERSAEDLKCPIGIAQLSGQAASKDVMTVLWLMAMISANLALVNLLPVPLLDGGHLAFYTVEALRGRPLAEKFQEYSFRFGFILLISLMVFTLFNDLRRLI
jgi:regulator of sigma E protease